MAARFTLDEEAFGRLVLTAPFMQAEMLGRANVVAGVARATGPVDETGPHPGRYVESIRTESGVRPAGGGRSARAVGRVVADAPEARFVEHGTERQMGHHTLARALETLKE